MENIVKCQCNVTEAKKISDYWNFCGFIFQIKKIAMHRIDKCIHFIKYLGQSYYCIN